MVRAGSILIGLAVASDLYSNYFSRVVVLAFVIAGCSLLLVGREPRPHCCEHCPRQFKGSPSGRHASTEIGSPDTLRRTEPSLRRPTVSGLGSAKETIVEVTQEFPAQSRE